MSEKRRIDDALASDSVSDVRKESAHESWLRAIADHGNTPAALVLVFIGALGALLMALFSEKHGTTGFQLFSSLISLAAGYLFASGKSAGK